jgi:hypothetical protein
MTLSNSVFGRNVEEDSPSYTKFEIDFQRIKVGPGKITYLGKEFNLSGYYDEIFISPMHMFLIFQRYEQLIRQRDLKSALKLEAKHKYPETWLNSVFRNVSVEIASEEIDSARRDQTNYDE